jgi:hypothetical protein
MEDVLKKILIGEDNESMQRTYAGMLNDFFSNYEAAIIATFSEVKEYALGHLLEIEFVVLDGELDELSHPIAILMRDAGYKGLIFLCTGNIRIEEVVPKENRWAFNGIFFKPFLTKDFSQNIIEKWLA